MTKELKKKHSSRLVGGAEMAGWKGLPPRQRLEDWEVPHSCADKPVGTTKEQDRQHNPGFQCMKPKPQNL